MSFQEMQSKEFIGKELFRKTNPTEIIAHIQSHWEENIKIYMPENGKKTDIIPDHWEHGAGREFERLVMTGSLLTEPISGTEIPTEFFTQSLGERGFRFFHGATQLSYQEAAFLLQLDSGRDDGKPVVQAIRHAYDGVPVVIEYYAGEQNTATKTMTRVANKQQDDGDIQAYEKAYLSLLRKYAKNGTTRLRMLMGLSSEFSKDYTKIKLPDDCKASAVSDVAYMFLLKSEKLWRERMTLVESTGTHVTYHAASVLLAFAETFDIPMIIRGGAPGKALGKGDVLNYIQTPEGEFLIGDVGNLTERLNDKSVMPQVKKAGNGSHRHFVVCMLRGGWPVMNTTYDLWKQYGKTPNETQIVIPVGRVHEYEKNYGALFQGLDVIHKAYNGKEHI